LKARLRQCLQEIYDVKLQMNTVLKDAMFSHTEARHAAGDFNNKVIAKVENAAVKVQCRRDNVVGVSILQFDYVQESTNDESLLGLARGGVQIRKCKDAYTDAVKLLIRLASLQTSFRELDEAMRVTNRRVNALDNVVIPKLENTVYYIMSELDERDREDLYRLKKVVSKKKKQAKLAWEERRQRELETAQTGVLDKLPEDSDVDYVSAMKQKAEQAPSMIDEMHEDPEDDVADEL